jgi:uncharacterized protein (DUF488 family)
VPAVATIGVYGFTLDRFLDTLRRADVRLLLDVRQRRGVRGSEYAWANSARLQSALAESGIAYRHHSEDDRLGVGKRSRVALAPAYRERYLEEILDRVDLAPIVRELPTRGSSALFCVERDPEACHRSLIAARLAHEYGVAVVHLRPAQGTNTP